MLHGVGRTSLLWWTIAPLPGVIPSRIHLAYANKVTLEHFDNLDILHDMAAVLPQRKANVDAFEEAALRYFADVG